MATVHGGGILRFLFADSLSTRDAANHGSGHASVEWSNELLMGNSRASQLRSATDQSITDCALPPNQLLLQLVIKPIRRLRHHAEGGS